MPKDSISPRDSYPQTRGGGFWLAVAIAGALLLVLTEHLFGLAEETLDIVYAVVVPLILGAFGMVVCVMSRVPWYVRWIVIVLTVAVILISLFLVYQAGVIRSFEHGPFG